MRERGWGRIVNITSIATKEPIPGLMLSNSHRLAAVGMFKTLCRRAGPRRHPAQQRRARADRHRPDRGDDRHADRGAASACEQPDVPVGRLGRIDEFGDVVAFLCSERASYVCGVNLLVDGGVARGI